MEVLEEDYVERLSGVRLARKGSDVVVDLLFASIPVRRVAATRSASPC